MANKELKIRNGTAIAIHQQLGRENISRNEFNIRNIRTAWKLIICRTIISASAKYKKFKTIGE
ncbi:hypothetical protein ACV56Z_00115 [Staphylococcus aureus]